jgi:chemotaxis protein methyltransferase CheR
LKNITDEELQSINRAILLRYGIDFNNYEQQSFKRRMSRALQKFEIANIFDLWKIILRDNTFVFKVIDEITVGLTELFRNPALWTFLKSELANNLKSKSDLSIWHAGCSTGEEVYTMSIVLHEINLLFKTQVWATDLSSQAIKTAEEGVYPDDIFKKYTENYRLYAPDRDLSQYFFRSQGNWQVFQTLKSHVSFDQHNLSKDTISGKFDVIFCRNVMIYFDEILKMKVLENFYDALREDGYFIIGYYDALPTDYQRFFQVYDASNKVFRKKK